MAEQAEPESCETCEACEPSEAGAPSEAGESMAGSLAPLEETLRGLRHVMSTFGSLSLHDRVAILVPDEDFAEGFRPALASALHLKQAGRPFAWLLGFGFTGRF